MCGLVAIYKTSNSELDPSILEGMTMKLRHRGPNDFGYAFASRDKAFKWREDMPGIIQASGIAMGHTRFSIFDLSTAGRQPFSSPNDRYWMVFNGEIYNYLELRSELSSLGHVFHTGTDTEVLLAAFAEWDTDCFSRFNGVWAVVIWDMKEERLVACRDRLGVKPLQYTLVNGDWLFASEAKALFAHPLVTARPDLLEVFSHLSQNTCPTEGRTLFESIFQVEAGTFISIHKGLIEKQKHWSLPELKGPTIKCLDDALEQYDFLLKDAVKMCLRSDIRVGATVSGGLDSTSVLATLVDNLGCDDDTQRSTGLSPQVFTASFPGESIDEVKKVKEVCGKLKLDLHTIFPMEEGGVEELARDVIYAMEMPFNSSVPIVNTLLLRKAKAEGVQIILNGYGPDEMFAGYPSLHGPLAAADALKKFRFGQCFNQLRGMVDLHGLNWKWALAGMLDHVLPFNVTPAHSNNNQKATDAYFRTDWLKKRQNPSSYEKTKGWSKLDRRLKWETFEDFMPRWIQMEDRITMASSVVTRQPFFDHRLIEFAFSLDNSLKVRDGYTKYIMRKAMHGRLPESVTHDATKAFFPGPNLYWMKGALKPMLNSILLSGKPRVSEFIGSSAIKEIVSSYLGGDASKAQLAWRLFNTELWMRTYFG